MNCNIQQLNITCGTDVVLHDRLVFDGETFDPALSVGITANLVSSLGKRTPLAVEVADGALIITIPWVDGRTAGYYGLEVTGSCNHKKWATYADGLIHYTRATEMGAVEVEMESDYYDITQVVGYRYSTSPIDTVTVTVDGNVGTPSGDAEYDGHTLAFDFSNLKGNGIASITTTESTEDGGTNTVTITDDLDNETTLSVKNGRRGEKGDTVILGDGEEYTLYNVTGNNTDGAMTQKAVTDAISNAIEQYGITDVIINALLACFEHVAWTSDDGQSLYESLQTALYHNSEIVGIEATYTQSGYIYNISSLDDLKAGLVVKAVYGNGAKVEISNYTLSGTLTAGTSTITVSYGTFATTFNVTVTQYGTVMYYSISGGDLVRSKGSIGNYGTIQAIGGVNTKRECVVMPLGVDKLRNTDGSYSNYYPIPVPTNAVSCYIEISSGYVFGCRGIFYIDGEYYSRTDKTTSGGPEISNGGWTTGQTYTLSFGDYAGRSDLYLLVNLKKTNDAVISDSDIYNLQVTFTTA